MERLGKGLRAGLIVIVVMLLVAVIQRYPAQAQQDDEIAITFRLTLYGTPPSNDGFQAIWLIGGPEEQEGTNFCGRDEVGRVESACDGGDTVYEKEIPYPWTKGVAINFRFVRIGSPSEAFFEDERVLHEDTVISAYYDYDSGQGGEGDGPPPPDVPARALAGSRGVDLQSCRLWRS